MPRIAFFLLFGLLFAVWASTGCGVLGDDDEDSPDSNGASNGGSGGVTVVEAVMSTEVTPERQATGFATRAFPQGTREVHAVLVLDGVAPGTEVTGRWFQLSASDAGPEGHFVTEGSTVLTEETVSPNGRARVALDFAHNTGSLPNGDWVVRVYVDGEFVRTMGFVISSFASFPDTPPPTPSGATGPTGAQPTPVAQPEPTATQAAPETYTVQPGDTLTTIAAEFKGPAESTDAYIQRLLELNGLQPGTILFVDQVLDLPPPQ